jgi:hypothetical protein
MHGPALCSALLGFVFLDAVSAATRARLETFSKHSSKPLETMVVNEDEAVLLQAGELNLRSKMQDHGDYAPAKERRPTNCTNRNTSKRKQESHQLQS